MTSRTFRTIRPLRGRVSAVVSDVGCWYFVRNHLKGLIGLIGLNFFKTVRTIRTVKTITRSGITLRLRLLVLSCSEYRCAYADHRRAVLEGNRVVVGHTDREGVEGLAKLWFKLFENILNTLEIIANNRLVVGV